jgi:demethoxyubiquinone hydroxylase (CLK1/Coq7/Cat5 family)
MLRHLKLTSRNLNALLINKRCLSSDEKKEKFIKFYKSLPDESKEALDRIIRVDHAGEFGADRIYAGQMAVLGKTEVGPTIQVFIFMISKVDSTIFNILIF